MTAGGVARRRASLAPQPLLPELDHTHTIMQHAMADNTVSDDRFMAAVEDDV